MPIRIVLVDEHSIVREGLRVLLDQQSGMRVVGEANDGAQALVVIGQTKPTLAIMDLRMPDADSIETVGDIRLRHPEVSIMIFSGHADAGHVRRCIAAGATGFLLKNAPKDDIVRAVREVNLGHAWLHPEAQRHMLDWMRRPASPLEQLTPREKSVLRLLAHGHSNKQIADRLALTPGTVKGYVSHILNKLRVNDRTQAALIAHKEGFGGS